jgi:acetyl-CoA acetyltransferase
MIADATKVELAETARILALQAAHYARKYGELPLPDLHDLLRATELDADKIALLRDCTEALVGVLASVAGFGEDAEHPMQ